MAMKPGERPCSAELPCEALNPTHVLLWGECWHREPGETEVVVDANVPPDYSGPSPLGNRPRPYRQCGQCNERSVPRGIDWPWWFAGRPVCLACVPKVKRENPQWGS